MQLYMIYPMMYHMEKKKIILYNTLEKEKIYTILSDYIATDEGAAVMDEIYGWTGLVPAVNSEFDVVKQAAEEFGLYDN